MAQQALRLWLSRPERSPRGGRKRRAWQLPRRAQPHLEILEGRCLPSTVTNLNDDGAGSLRQAIMETPAGGTVDFQPGMSGTITLTTGELLIDHDMTIAGPGANVITVSGNHASRVFEIPAASTVALSGLTIADGAVANMAGGGVTNAGTLIIIGCSLTGNSASGVGFEPTAGGGIYNVGTVTIISSSVTGNSVVGFGGGVFNANTFSISDSTVTSNTATGSTIDNDGGGIENAGQTTISHCVISENSVVTGGGNAIGGGIYNSEGALAIMDSTVSDNAAVATVESSDVYGGGISIMEGTVTITRSAVSGNFAGSGGGGIGIGGGTLAITDSTISDNSIGLIVSVVVGGAGIYNNFGSVTLAGSTVSGNSARRGVGGGILFDSGPAQVRDTIVAGNTAPADRDVGGSFASLGHNLIGDGTGGSGYGATDLVGTFDHPIDPMLAPLADNGGPTQTMALLPGSPAIDAGDNTNVPQWDQRGPDFPRIVNRATDIGAYEVQSIERPINGPFDSFALPPCDHCSSPETPLGFTFNFFGRSFNSVWVNNNGTISFDGAFSDYVPGPLARTGRAVLAPFWADVLTASPGAGEVTYGRGMLDGDPAFAATWHDVTSSNPSEFENYFQVVLIDHADRGFQEVQFNYVTVRWDQAGSPDQAPRVGYNNGAGMSGEMPGSGTFDALLDSGSQALQVVRRYTLIVYPFTVVGGLTGDFAYLTPSGSGNQPAFNRYVPFGATDRTVPVIDQHSADSALPANGISTQFSLVASPMILPRLGAASSPDNSAILDLVWADNRLLL